MIESMTLAEYARQRGKSQSTVRGWVQGWELECDPTDNRRRVLSASQVMELDKLHNVKPLNPISTPTPDNFVIEGEIVDVTIARDRLVANQLGRQRIESAIVPQVAAQELSMTERSQSLAQVAMQARQQRSNLNSLTRAARRKALAAQAQLEAIEDHVYREEIYFETLQKLESGEVSDLVNEQVEVEPEKKPPSSVGAGDSFSACSASDYPC